MKKYLNMFKNVLKMTNRKIGLIIQMFISSAIFNSASLLPPVATAGIIAVITQNNFSDIWLYVFLYCIFYALYFSALYWNYDVYNKLGNYYHIEAQKLLFEKVAKNNLIVSKISKGKIMETCGQDVCYIADIVDKVVESTMNIIKLFIIIIIFICYNMSVAFIVLILDYIYIKLMENNTKNVSKHYEGTRKYNDKIVDVLNQMMLNLKQVKIFSLLPNLDLKLDKIRDRWKEEHKKRHDYLTIRYSVIPIIVYLGKIFLYIFLAYLVIKKEMTLDKMLLLISYFELVITCTDKLLEASLSLGDYEVRFNRIETILNYSSRKTFDFGDINNDYINGSVEFKNVDYKIKGKKVLNDVSFKIYPNEINTIIGHSGSGKSTIVNLLYRLDKITSGEILIDKYNIYDYSYEVYHSNVSGVFQKPIMFEMSIKDNLSLLDPNINNQINACKRVGIHEFIRDLPKGYNTMITVDSNILPEGIKQLLSIARSLLSKAEILLLDEVTSNIDDKYTKKIQKILLDLKTDHTIIMVTHKPEMMDISDRIIVLKEGRVIIEGKNKEVYKNSIEYRELKNKTYASVSDNMLD